ncbi:MAG: response regulator transcription factor [Flavisolibacter sp.]
MQSSTSIRVLIADEHSIFREGLKNLIKDHSLNIKLTGEARHEEELLRLIPEAAPDIILLDSQLLRKHDYQLCKHCDVNSRISNS